MLLFSVFRRHLFYAVAYLGVCVLYYPKVAQQAQAEPPHPQVEEESEGQY